LSSYEKNKEKIKEDRRKKYHENPEEQKARMRVWESNNVEYRRLYRQEWYKLHKDRIRDKYVEKKERRKIDAE